MRRLPPLEGLTIIFLGITLLLVIFFYPQFPHGSRLLATFIPLLLLALALSTVRSRWGAAKTIRFFCDFSPIFFVIAIYEWLADFIPYLCPNLDDLLIRTDLALFGVHPTVWLERISRPWLTEILSSVYASYYFIPVILIVSLYFWGEENGFYLTIFTLLLGYYISFLGYMAMPSIGPRFTLVSVQEVPLSRGGIAEFFMHTLDLLERNKWDCFPSGHTQMVLISLWFAFKYRRVLYWAYLPVAITLIFSTVYLRYHYVVDIIAGFAFAGGTLFAGPAIWRWWVREQTDRLGRSCISSPPRPLSPSA